MISFVLLHERFMVFDLFGIVRADLGLFLFSFCGGGSGDGDTFVSEECG